MEKLVRPFRERIYSVHLHDNNGWGDGPGCGDAHRIPGDPDFPWKAFMAVLKDSAYEAPLVLEVVKHGDENAEDFLQRAMQSGEWLYSLMS